MCQLVCNQNSKGLIVQVMLMVANSLNKWNQNKILIHFQLISKKYKWIANGWGTCEAAWSGGGLSKFFGLAFRVGERSTWVWIAVITVSHERMVICIHFYIWIFSDIFTPDSAQTHWFTIFLSTFFESKVLPWLLRNNSHIFVWNSNEVFRRRVQKITLFC